MTPRRGLLALVGGAGALAVATTTASTAALIQAAGHDDVLISACVAFCQAQADFDVANAESGWCDTEIKSLQARWDITLQAVLMAPPPMTPSGQIAIAKAAKVALRIAVDDLGPGGWDENAGPEHQLILMALSSTVGSAVA